jgi:serine/threonine protein kinase
MGVVYRAWQPSLSRQVALKCLLGSGDPRTEARFAREIRALGRVDHPNLVKVYSSGSEGDQWFYAMELIEGADVASVLAHLASTSSGEVGESEWERALSTACIEARRKEESVGSSDPSKAPTAGAEPPPLPGPRPRPTARGHIEQVVSIARQAAEAAHALHEAGVVHRDIKPGNIMLTADGAHAVLMDLGVAQLADEAEGRLTRTRQFVGTLRYASPEQVLAAGNLDRRSDVYSLGATLFELLTLSRSPSARKVKLLIGSDDGIRVWLDGAVVHQHLVGRDAIADQDEAWMDIPAGEHRLLVEVTQHFGDWRLYLRIEDEAGRELRLTDDGDLEPIPGG